MTEETTTVSNMEELFELYGACNAHDLGRSLYKYTSAGVWTVFYVPDKPARTLTVAVEITRGPEGRPVIFDCTAIEGSQEEMEQDQQDKVQ